MLETENGQFFSRKKSMMNFILTKLSKKKTTRDSIVEIMSYQNQIINYRKDTSFDELKFLFLEEDAMRVEINHKMPTSNYKIITVHIDALVELSLIF